MIKIYKNVQMRYTNSAVLSVFLGIPVQLSSVYLNGSDGHPLWVGHLLEKTLEFIVSRLA